MKCSPDGRLHIFNITEIRGDWALKDVGHAIADYTHKCVTLMRWDWTHPNATGWAKMKLQVDPAGIADAECVASAIKKAGGPANSFCFQAS